MKTRILATLALTVLIAPLSAIAQGGLNVIFTTAFSFYAGGAKLPAGTYTLRQSGDDENLFNIQDSSGKHTVLLEGRQSSKTTTGSPEISFNRYGTSEYLEGVQTSSGTSVDIETSKAESVTSKKGSPEAHTVSAK